MQFADDQFRHKHSIALSFRKSLSYKADKVAQLAEEVCQEHFELNFQETFSSSVKDLAARDSSKELKVECGMHQGDKVGTSAVIELTRNLNKVNLLIFSLF